MIDDKELLALFREESDEYLQSLDDGLMQLEAKPQDAAALQQVFRDAHSLKGAARMLGIGDVEIVAHHFEDALGGAARGGQTLAPKKIETLYRTLDALRALVAEAVTGKPSGIDMNALLANFSEEKPQTSTVEFDRTPFADNADARANESMSTVEFDRTPRDANRTRSVSEGYEKESTVKFAHTHSANDTNEFAHEKESAVEFDRTHQDAENRTRSVSEGLTSVEISAPEISTEIAPAKSHEIAPAQIASNTLPRWNIETIRVEPVRLDGLLAMAGELVVATTRARRGRADFEALRGWLDEAGKTAAAQNRTLHELERASARADANTNEQAAPANSIAALRELRRQSERDAAQLEQLAILLGRLSATYEDVNRLNSVVGELESSIRGIRLLPLSTLFGLFPRSVRDLAKTQNKDVRFVIEGGETTADKRILEDIKDPLMHMIRNAIDHGIETTEQRVKGGKPAQALLRLRGFQTATQVVIELSDDGRGLDIEKIRQSAARKGLATEDELHALNPRQVQNLIFAPGFSTSAIITDVSGRGVGLDVVRANVERLRGTIHVESVAGQGCTFRLTLPVTLATTRVLLVRAASQIYALPVDGIERIQRVASEEIFSLQNRACIELDGAPLPLAPLAPLLQMGESEKGEETACVVIADGNERLGLLVDALVDEQEIMLKPLGALLENVPAIMGATILDTGDVCLVLQPHGLIERAHGFIPALPRESEEIAAPKSVLLVEDSITTRTQEKRILESAGYLVTTAVDGLDGWQKLQNANFDAVVSDVEMPNLDGLSLAARIRADARHSELPIILVTSLASDDDRRRGVEVGASAYITKGGFDQRALLDALKALV